MPSLKNFWKKLGPGLVTGVSDDDPSGIATYSQAGAQFGLSTLWTALITFPLMVSIQEICARIGNVTSNDLVENIKKKYSNFILYPISLMTCAAIILNIGADISSMGAVANLLLPRIPAFIFSIFFTLTILICMIKFSYLQIATILKYICLTLFLYVIVPFLVHKNWQDIFFHTFIPTISFDKAYLSILVAILGTTISPYLFFWQATMESEEEKLRKKHGQKKNMKDILVDVVSGMFVSNLVMYFIILTTGIVLFKESSQINTVEEAARALQPLAGKACYLLFAIGILSTGILAIPVLSGSVSYIFTSTFNLNKGLDKKIFEAKAFYAVIFLSLFLGLVINFIGFNPIQILIYAAILYGLISPILIFLILKISNDKKIMGMHKNGLWSNVCGWITFWVMLVAAISYLFFSF